MDSNKLLFLVFSWMAAIQFLGVHGNFNMTGEYDPCPFNPTCFCKNTNSSIEAYCHQLEPSLPVFKTQNGEKYNLASLQIISSQVHRLPANYFSVFENISSLELIRMPQSSPDGKYEPAPQEWHEQAFDKVHIEELIVDGVDSVLKSSALSKVVMEGLTVKSGGPISFSDGALWSLLSFYDSLKKLRLHSTESLKITDNLITLSGLRELGLLGPKVVGPLFDKDENSMTFAILFMKYLETLDLSRTNVTSIDLCMIANKPKIFLNLEGTTTLRDLQISRTSYLYYGLERYPDPASINLRRSGIKNIDRSVEILLENYPNTTIDLSFTNLNCSEDLQWLSPFVFCTKAVKVEGSMCAYGPPISVREYLFTTSPGCGYIELPIPPFQLAA